MYRQLTAMIQHMATSQQEMAKILEAKRLVAVHMANLVHDIPPNDPSFEDIEEMTQNTLSITKNIAAYLSSLADLEDVLADHLAVVLKEVEIPDIEE